MYNMKKIFIVLASVLVFSSSLRADEGMWMLPLLEKMNANPLKESGCRLSPEQIYSVNNSSLKDAIVNFGDFCTGEVISDQGLVVTNHHCGYGAIQALSSVEHDYLNDGYWAMKNTEELPAEGLHVTFLEKMVDITKHIDKARSKAEKAYKDSTAKDELIQKALSEVADKLCKKIGADYPHSQAVIESFYEKNVYYVMVYTTFNDIRFVGAPPSSIGKFGADTDNWMWPRHTGDFSMFRIYADKDNNPAEYSKDNVPYSPKQSLKISLKGIKEGDYSMVMGYPGSTIRYATAPELNTELVTNDIRIEARTIRQDIIMKDMLADPKVNIQYAAKYSQSSNGWKYWQGMKLAFKKLSILDRAKENEANFNAWVGEKKKTKEKYSSVLADLEKLTNSNLEAKKALTKIMESVGKIELTAITGRYNASLTAKLNEAKSAADTTKVFEELDSMLDDFYKDYSVSTDEKVAKAMLTYYREKAESGDYLKDLGEDFAGLDIEKYVDDLYANSIFTSKDKLKKALASDKDAINNDPALVLYSSIKSMVNSLSENANKGKTEFSKARKTYLAGLMEWKKGEPIYPDANFTMRLTYGSIGGYSPADAVTYSYVTTLDGVMQKEDPNNWEFEVPQKLKDLYNEKDFGEYAMENGKMPVAFLSNNDITGGNSGSPVLDADGALIGLAFDGNWEAMSGDIIFEPELQRCINVDIRYVLFIMDKFGGASWLLDEMEILR